MNAFHKPPLSVDEQLQLLAERGLIIDDEGRARHYLTNISYYRLSAYTRPFYIPGQQAHRFIPGTRFEQVLDLYVFDRELRLLLLDAIERLEVALRAQLIQVLAMNYRDPFCYLDASLFDSRYNHAWLLEELERKAGEKKVESFLAHYRQQYPHSPTQPPIWMAMELLTFTQISMLFSNLRRPADQQPIAIHFGWPHRVLASWFRSLSDLRNWCAHHSRVWNRELGTAPIWPRKGAERLAEVQEAMPGPHGHHINARKRLYVLLVIIENLMARVSPDSQWARRLAALLEKHPQVSRVHMGMPPHWQQDSFWQDALKPEDNPS